MVICIPINICKLELTKASLQLITSFLVAVDNFNSYLFDISAIIIEISQPIRPAGYLLWAFEQLFTSFGQLRMSFSRQALYRIEEPSVVAQGLHWVHKPAAGKSNRAWEKFL
ncbi:hypothetical protein T12_4116 [Trichinella patagoniensis]|uniref:Uncharacterized protein n=1 Tax=Trichinella patagoniensis TaxID=990121 RepID=A0A0V0ZIM2_9BILA|nr:hypothetical protein T12_4116 [Trichinella patagoniensis]